MSEKIILVGDEVIVSPATKIINHIGEEKRLNQFTKEEVKGIVIMTGNGQYGIDLKKEFEFTHDINGLIGTFTGIITESRYIRTTIKRTLNKSIKNNFAIILKQNDFARSYVSPHKIRSIEDRIISRQNSIIENNERIKHFRKEIIQQNIQKKMLFNVAKSSSNHNEDYYENMFDKITNHPNVSRIEVPTFQDSNHFVIYVFSKRIKFKPTTGIKSFYEGTDLGEILIRFELKDNGFKYNAVNTKLFHTKNETGYFYFHPCIHERKICIGNLTGGKIKEAMQKNEIHNAIYFLLNFFEQPDYGSPYVEIKLWKTAQKIKSKPNDTEDYFKKSFWQNNYIWDSSQYDIDRKIVKEEEEKWIKKNRRHAEPSSPQESQSPNGEYVEDTEDDDEDTEDYDEDYFNPREVPIDAGTMYSEGTSTN